MTPPAQVTAAIFMTFVAMAAIILIAAVPTKPLIMNLAAIAAILAVCLGTASRRLSRLPELVFLIFMVVFGALALLARPHPEQVGMPFVVLIAVSFGILCDIAAISVTRILIRWQTSWRTFRGVALAAVAELLLGLALVWAPLHLGFKFMRTGVESRILYEMMTGWALLLSTLTNIGATTVAFSFFLALVALGLHRLCWPVLERPLYQLARLRIFQSVTTKSALFGLGVSLITVGLGREHEVLSFVLRLFGSA